MSTEFDWSKYEKVQEEAQPTSKSTFDWSKYEKIPSKPKSMASAFAKGLLKGGKSLGRLHDPLSFVLPEKETLESQVAEQALPTRKGEFSEELLERAGELAPGFLIGPGGAGLKAAQIGAGALGGQLLGEAGAPEWAQAIGEAATSLSPQAIKGALSKKLMPSAAQKEIHEMLKGYGFSDKEITPFIQSEKKSSQLSKIARGFLDPKKFKEETQSIPEMVYESIREKQELLSPLSGIKKSSFLDQFDRQLDKIPYTYKDLISKDINRLKNSEMRFKDLREFEAAINRKIGSEEGGKSVLGILKDPIKFGERLLSPELYKEKELMNKAYGSRMNILERLPESKKESLFEKVTEMGPIGYAAFAYAFGTPMALKAYGLKKGSEYLASKLLTSPRFQNMQQKMFKSLIEGNKGSVINLLSKMMDETGKITERQTPKEQEQIEQ